MEEGISVDFHAATCRKSIHTIVILTIIINYIIELMYFIRKKQEYYRLYVSLSCCQNICIYH